MTYITCESKCKRLHLFSMKALTFEVAALSGGKEVTQKILRSDIYH